MSGNGVTFAVAKSLADRRKLTHFLRRRCELSAAQQLPQRSVIELVCCWQILLQKSVAVGLEQ